MAEDSSARVPRLLYQSFGPPENGEYIVSLRHSLVGIGQAFGVGIEVGTLSGARLGEKQHRVFHLGAGAQLVAQLYAARYLGFDAAVIGNIQDPGLYEARQACPFPVAGLLESTLTATRPFAATIGLITTTAVTIPLIRERVLMYGDERRVRSVRPLGVALPSLLHSFGEPSRADELLRTFADRARDAVADGCEVIIPAAGMLAELLAARLGATAAWDIGVGAPIANPVFLAVSVGASAARLAAAGLPISRAGTYATPPAGALDNFFRGAP